VSKAKTVEGERARPKASARKKKTSPAPARSRRTRVPSRAAAGELQQRLTRAVPHPHVELLFQNPWQLLVAVILSAQSTDRRVNLVTPDLFRRWPGPAALAAAPPDQVEEVIKSTGFFRNKTKAIQRASGLVMERFGGDVPRTMEELLELPGVARKTANVILGSAYGVASGIATDTHVMRVARRLGLTLAETPEKIELDLCQLFPPESWTAMGHRLLLHGRYVCTARSPACADCPLNELCPSRLNPAQGPWEERAEHEAAEMQGRAQGFVRL
jgi:endonuclease III